MKKLAASLFLFQAITANATELTADYLLGPWCLLEENRNWVFEADGKFLMQQSASSSKLKHSANWKVVDGQLDIRPVYMGGAQPVIINSQDNFTFKWMMELQVERGACK